MPLEFVRADAVRIRGTGGALAELVGASAAHEAKIVVGPNMLVSRDGDFPHMETSVAVNPRNIKNLFPEK